jgi:AcrR family transcriptional regulator
MPSSRRRGAPRRLDPDQRRAQLLRVGLELVTSEPLDAVTAPAVAHAAGVSKALVFHYFPTQRELQAAIAREAADRLLRLFASTDPAASYDERFAAALDAFIEFVEQQPASYLAIARGSGSDELLNAVFEDFREGVVDLIAAGIGLAGPGPRERLYLRGWVAMVEELILQWVASRAITRAELTDFLRSSAPAVLAAADLVGGPDLTGG